jgi:aminopeptidase N
MIEGGEFPRAAFGHEVAHLWTQGEGPATNFLQEGWAGFVETALVRARLGEQARRERMRKAAQIYFEAFDGKLAILADGGNAGVSYMKGLWIFAMLEDILGPRAFDKAMTEFSRRSLQQPATWQVLLECLNRGSERDLRRFLLPWLEQPSAPRLETRITGNRVTIVQVGARFELPVEVEAEMTTGQERRRVWIEGPETILEFGGTVRWAGLDPDGRLLLKP